MSFERLKTELNLHQVSIDTDISIVYKLDGKFYKQLKNKEEVSEEEVIHKGYTVITFKKPKI